MLFILCRGLLGIILCYICNVHSVTIYPKKVLTSNINIDRRLPVRTLLIDNFDSYTYNIWQLLSEINGLKPYVVSNNDFNSDWDTLIQEIPDFDNIVISPGPGSPDKASDFGLCLNAILKSNVPLLGVCLGHQGIAYAYGGKVSKAPLPMHGRLSKISHDDSSLFSNIKLNSDVVRYHSLMVHDLPAELRATAWTDDISIDVDPSGTVIMALEHISKPQYGVQFHPESIKTPIGRSIISNFKDITLRYKSFIKKHNSFIGKHYNLNIYSNNIINTHDNVINKKQTIVSKGMDLLSEGDGTQQQQQKRLRCVHISSIHIDPLNHLNTTITTEDIFESIYGNHHASFWLDSQHAAASSIDILPPLNNNNPNDHSAGKSPSSRMSYMGAIDTGSAYAIEYMGNHQLTQRFLSPESNEYSNPKQFNSSIFQFIRDKLDEESNTLTSTTIEEINYKIGELVDTSTTSTSFITTTEESESYQHIELLPFQTSGTLFGYLGYELGTEALHILNESNGNKKQLHTKYNLSSLSSEELLDNNFKLSQPLAVLLYPSRYIVYDHDKSIYYIVSYIESLTFNEKNKQNKESLHKKAKESGDKLMNKVISIINKRTKQQHLSNKNFDHKDSNNGSNNKDILIPTTTKTTTATTTATITPLPPTLTAWKSKESYKNDIANCLENIACGETYEVCLTLQFNGPLKQRNNNQNNNHHNNNHNNNNNLDIDGSILNSYLETYKTLRKYNPAPYACYLRYDPFKYLNHHSYHSISFSTSKTTTSIEDIHFDIATSNSINTNNTNNNHNNNIYSISNNNSNINSNNDSNWYKEGGFAVCCTSPECFLKITPDRKITSKPIKGTARRNLYDVEDDKNRIKKLANDEKSQAENLMIVDLVRNDLGRVCDIGSIHVPNLMNIETYASVHQMVSTISGRLSKDHDIVDALIATFPGGSMTGAPKMRTMNLISKLEGNPRGIYSGTIGYIGLNGVADLNIVIRTALVSNNTITIGAGGAIVALSNSEEEVNEVLLKANSVSAALGYTIKFPST